MGKYWFQVDCEKLVFYNHYSHYLKKGRVRIGELKWNILNPERRQDRETHKKNKMGNVNFHTSVITLKLQMM